MKIQTRKLTKATSATFWGAGFIAMDVVDLGTNTFVATGGSCGNVNAILGWLGWRARPIARMGNDVVGCFVREELSNLGIDIACLFQEAGVRTPVVLHRFSKSVDGTRSHHFSFNCPECGRWLPRHRSITLNHARSLEADIETPNVFYFDRVSPATLLLAASARANGSLVVFEPESDRDETKFLKAVALCHVLKYSQDSLRRISKSHELNSPDLVVETRGASGLRYRWKDRWFTIPAFGVRTVIDAAGSGDWCTAFLVHMLARAGMLSFHNAKRQHVEDALRIGQAAAAINCGYVGARGVMRSLTTSELFQKLERVYTQGINENGHQVSYETADEAPKLRYCVECEAIALAATT